MEYQTQTVQNKKMINSIVGLVILSIIGIIFSVSMFITIQPGEAGVIFRKFSGGLDKEHIYEAGFEMVAPWNSMIIYEVREQQNEETMNVLDKNGLDISVDVTVRFNPIFSKIGNLHETFGLDYKSRLVGPEVRSAVRKVMGRFSAEEIYSTKRKEVENTIEDETESILKENNIQMKALLIRSINLPDKIKGAIENKLQQEQEALAYRFKLEKEKSEAERKRIAAEGEATANKIINSSLTSSLLRMRGIEATIELSKSPNAKTVIIGSSKDGLPLILGNN